ncbi:virulence protein RhuM/Fic/DOC family protein [Bacteroides sp. K03]|uniref:virulence protein RhuM/Fic/DOC family protein n=1 Tax=Bacteroides sp. K03 TaxID=2718928 RepID=UPI001C8CC47A|nr:virulence protein RhuM/Fic/DOC family protein [Bacteroides sp. K03]MBX9188603.1 virulence protein RhuM/Fic/DOC family protein [Bacteroides sp. K03]
MNTGEIILYTTSDGTTALDVRLEQETIWLTQKQIAELFGTKRPAITKHLKNIFSSGELDENSTCSILEHMGNDGKQHYRTTYYNLDAILSIGYRVNSKNATRFRIWANKVLKEYLIKGYAVKENIKLDQYEDLKQTIKVLANVLDHKTLEYSEATGLLRVVTDYAYALDTLDRYDYQQLEIEKTTNTEQFRATYDNAMAAIDELREKFGGSSLFGNEKDQSFKGSIGAIYQTFGQQDLYPSIEEKVAILLYLVTKNHSFSDGNKRIAAFLFLWFMERNGILYNTDGSKRIGNNTLVALTLMIAESRTEEMETMVKVIVNLINKNN